MRLPLAISPPKHQLAAMQDTATVDCPFCGQSMELLLDTNLASQRFVTDCEVCCRPFEVTAECENGDVLSVSAAGN